MANRKLSDEELEKARKLLGEVRESLAGLSGGDSALLFAYRRKLAKELGYDERNKPAQRRALKRRKLIGQNGLCAACGCALPPGAFGAVLDRVNAMDGYTDGNTRLICRDCDLRAQKDRSYAD
jgi:hypothetical protein